MKGFFLLQVELPDTVNRETQEAMLHAMAKQLSDDLNANPQAKLSLVEVSIEHKQDDNKIPLDNDYTS